MIKKVTKVMVYMTVLILLGGCGSSSTDSVSTDLVTVDTANDQNSSSSSLALPQMQIYFSKTEGDYSGGADDLIVNDIDHAEGTIFLAMYDFTNDKIADALIRAKKRGVSTAILTDDSKVSDEIYMELADVNITLYHDDDPYALMHDKFLVIDDHIIWMGSANFTYYAFYRNNENSIRWDSEALASYYREEFQERIEKSLTDKIYEENHLFLYFSPEDDFRSKLVDLINHATNEIEFMIYTFTDAQISDALLAAHSRGVNIKGIFDEDQDSYQSYSKYATLLENGVDVKLDGNAYKLHHKVMIIDGNTTVVGSYNFTDAANTKNSEESMVIYDSNVSTIFLNEFNRLFDAAK